MALPEWGEEKHVGVTCDKCLMPIGAKLSRTWLYRGGWFISFSLGGEYDEHDDAAPMLCRNCVKLLSEARSKATSEFMESIDA